MKFHKTRFYLSLSSFLIAFPVVSLETEQTPCPILIADLKGITLSGTNTQDRLPFERGIVWKDLKIPGCSYDLCKELSTFLDQPVTMETLTDIKKVIAQYYLRQSRPFVVIKIPKQEITSGVLQLTILESCLGSVCLEGNQYSATEKIKRYIESKPGEPVDQSRLIKNVSFINRNPFRRVDLVFTPGNEEGTTNVVLSTKDRRPFRIYAGTDNLGVDPLGDNQWYAGFNWGNAFGLDHILSYQFTSSYDIHYFQAHTAEYTAFYSWGHLLNIYGGYSEVHPPVSPPLKRNDGWSMQVSARYVVPLKIYQYLEHEISAGLDFKRTNNTFEFTEDFPVFGRNVNLTQVMAAYSGNYERNVYRLDFKGAFFWSPGRLLSDQTNADYSSLRPGAVNKWVYFRGYFIYLQRLPKSYSFSLRLQGQGATEPLLPSEQFGLGGYETVRGYDEREINTDNALVLNLEARSPALPLAKWIKPTCTIPDGLQFLVFLDGGWGVNIVSIPGTTKVNYLIGAGPGVRYTLEPYLTARLDWGIRLHNQSSFGGNWNHLHFNVTASY